MWIHYNERNLFETSRESPFLRTDDLPEKQLEMPVEPCKIFPTPINEGLTRTGKRKMDDIDLMEDNIDCSKTKIVKREKTKLNEIFCAELKRNLCIRII